MKSSYRFTLSLVHVDGVLAEQIPHLIQHLQKKKGIAATLTKKDVVEWAFNIDGTDIAAEMEDALLEPTFVSTMPVVSGAVTGMSQLHKQMHVVIATSRPLDSHDAIEWLNSHFKSHEIVNARQRGKSGVRFAGSCGR